MRTREEIERSGTSYEHDIREVLLDIRELLEAENVRGIIKRDAERNPENYN